MPDVPIVLPTVTIRAGKPTTPPTSAKKYRTAKEKVKLYPKGEIDKSTVDSLVKAGRGALIGQPLRRPGQMDQYGAVNSDIIKQLTKKK